MGCHMRAWAHIGGEGNMVPGYVLPVLLRQTRIKANLLNAWQRIPYMRGKPPKSEFMNKKLCIHSYIFKLQ